MRRALLFLAVFAGSGWAQSGTAPLYYSTTSTANPGVISPLFSGTIGTNQTAYDTTYNPAPLDCYTRATDSTTFAGNSVGGNTYTSGANDVMWSRNSDYVGTTGSGWVYILNLNLSGNCAQVLNTGQISGGSSYGIEVTGPFAFSRQTDNVFYNVINHTQIYKNTITIPYNKTYTPTLVFDVSTCPQFSGLTGWSWDGILGVNNADTRFALGLSNIGGQGTGVYQVVYDTSLGCATANVASPGADWIATHSYPDTPLFVTPVSGNAGGYTYETKVGGTSGGSAPTWNQTIGSTFTDNTVTWQNIGIAGQYYTFGASSPTGILATSTACTGGTDCSCWGNAMHDSQFSGDGSYAVLTNSNNNPAWSQGACSTLGSTNVLAVWTVGTQYTQGCSYGVTGSVGLQCGGHDSVGTSKIVSVQGDGSIDSTRALANTRTYTQFQTGSPWASHGWWSQWDGADDYPWVYTTYGLTSTGQDTGCGQPGYCPINGGNAISAIYPGNPGAYPPGQARTYFGHTYSCSDANDSPSGICTVPSGANWAATTGYTITPTTSIITPTSGNAGNYSFEASVGGTSGGSAPTWTQTVGATVTDGGVTWINLGVAGAAQYDSDFGCQESIMSVSQDGNWAALASGMLLSLGLDSSGQPRCDVFIVHIGQGVSLPAALPNMFTEIIVLPEFWPWLVAFVR